MKVLMDELREWKEVTFTIFFLQNIYNGFKKFRKMAWCDEELMKEMMS